MIPFVLFLIIPSLQNFPQSISYIYEKESEKLDLTHRSITISTRPATKIFQNDHFPQTPTPDFNEIHFFAVSNFETSQISLVSLFPTAIRPVHDLNLIKIPETGLWHTVVTYDPSFPLPILYNYELRIA
jgi:hypothetical protein